MSGVSFLLKWSLRAIFERDSLGDERTSSFQTVFLRVPGLRLAGTEGGGNGEWDREGEAKWRATVGLRPLRAPLPYAVSYKTVVLRKNMFVDK